MYFRRDRDPQRRRRCRIWLLSAASSAFCGGDDTLAVTPDIRCFPLGSSESQGEATGVSWKLGALRPGPKRPRSAVSHILYGCGGATAWDRKRFLMLGGFDSLYFPGYWEDVDLSWRGWKRGWRCLYEPRSVVYHAGGGPSHMQARKCGLFRYATSSSSTGRISIRVFS
jgi:hypothetical protein